MTDDVNDVHSSERPTSSSLIIADTNMTSDQSCATDEKLTNQLPLLRTTEVNVLYPVSIIDQINA